ncbi:VPS38-like protein [Elsinoe fawcettii]|nr:VPS38-like protein [Elsinoe fawcettii]
MASPAVETKQPKWTTRERPWLVPWNRKLRHLQSIALRNLALLQVDGRHRGKVIDDDALPNTLKSPAKQLALREGKTLGHSKSSDDLRPIHEDQPKSQRANGIPVNGSPKAPAKEKRMRPTVAKLRRRSTLEWASETPQNRQIRLEAVSAARLADVFFTLHVRDVKEPVYVSEEINKSMNPSFRHIDWDACGPGILRRDDIRVKFWARSGNDKRYEILLDISLNLRSLQFIGKDLATFSHPFPQNCVIFQLTDGYYTCFTDAQVEEPSDPFAVTRAAPSSPRTVRSASFDALLRLSKLDDSIQDALALRGRLTTDLTSIVETNHKALEEKNRVGEAKDYLKTISYAKTTVEKQLRSLRQTLNQKRASLEKRRDMLTTGRTEQAASLIQLTTSTSTLPSLHEDISTISKAISNQRRRIAHDLSSIYPIHPLPSKPLSFTIRTLHLPDSEDLDSSTPETIASAIGHASHVLQLLSFYLSQPLPYAPHPRSSTSSITDPISNIKSAPTSTAPIPSPYSSPLPLPAPLADPTRTFPLYPRSGPKFRFEYALFLLNKDIQVLLSNAFNVRVLDIRQTLPNLAYVVACMGAGEGELPGRKTGGVRGLARTAGEGRGWGTAIGVRREVSVTSSAGEGDEGKRGGMGMTREEFEAGRWQGEGVWDGSVRMKGKGKEGGKETLGIKGREGG